MQSELSIPHDGVIQAGFLEEEREFEPSLEETHVKVKMKRKEIWFYFFKILIESGSFEYKRECVD